MVVEGTKQLQENWNVRGCLLLKTLSAALSSSSGKPRLCRLDMWLAGSCVCGLEAVIGRGGYKGSSSHLRTSK